jgi:hypothetical protein
MKQLIKHLLQNNLEEILSRSLLNCHVKGLHSIMLSESPAKTIRLYVATPDHELYRNHYSEMDSVMSLAFHAHHCNLTLHCIKGILFNWEVVEDDNGSIELQKYIYHSKITEGDLSFEKIGTGKLRTTCHRYVNEGEAVFMKADQIHTVACEKNKLCAWLVYEGKEDKSYKPYCWTHSNVNNIDYSQLYQKPTEKQIMKLLKQIGLLNE